MEEERRGDGRGKGEKREKGKEKSSRPTAQSKELASDVACKFDRMEYYAHADDFSFEETKKYSHSYVDMNSTKHSYYVYLAGRFGSQSARPGQPMIEPDGNGTGKSAAILNLSQCAHRGSLPLSL